jgi:PAS domain S-box-containing protein
MPNPRHKELEKPRGPKTSRSVEKKIGMEYQQAISKLRLSDELLKASERKYRSLVESIPDIIFALDLKGAFTYIGPRWKKILRHDEKEVLGRYFVDFAPAEDHPLLMGVFREVKNENKSLENVQWRYFRKDGQIRFFSGSTAPLLDESGKLIGTMGIARDITEQKKLEEQLLQAQKMESIGNLAGGIAHDFNNFLGGILGYASFLTKKMSPGDPFYHSVSCIQRAAEQASELTKQLLGFARRGKYQVKPINCNALIQDLVHLLGRTIDKRITLSVDLDPHLHLIEGDETQLQQSLMNICLNSRDAMPSGGVLRIISSNQVISPIGQTDHRVWKEGEYVKVTLSDTGTGIPPEIQSQIFEPFFTTKEPGKGTGLGLSMVYGIIQNHGGYINLKSELDLGTTFELFFPARREIPQSEVLSPGPKIKQSKGHETILIVDDQDVIRQLGADILEDAGYKVLLAASGEEALQLYQRKKREIALVVLDVIMPGLGGKETFSRLKAINSGIKVLLSSGYSTDGEVGEIIKDGASGYIQKPYKDDQLIIRVQEILDPSDVKTEIKC